MLVMYNTYTPDFLIVGFVKSNKHALIPMTMKMRRSQEQGGFRKLTLKMKKGYVNRYKF